MSSPQHLSFIFIQNSFSHLSPTPQSLLQFLFFSLFFYSMTLIYHLTLRLENQLEFAISKLALRVVQQFTLRLLLSHPVLHGAASRSRRLAQSWAAMTAQLPFRAPLKQLIVREDFFVTDIKFELPFFEFPSLCVCILQNLSIFALHKRSL